MHVFGLKISGKQKFWQNPYGSLNIVLGLSNNKIPNLELVVSSCKSKIFHEWNWNCIEIINW